VFPFWELAALLALIISFAARRTGLLLVLSFILFAVVEAAVPVFHAPFVLDTIALMQFFACIAIQLWAGLRRGLTLRPGLWL